MTRRATKRPVKRNIYYSGNTSCNFSAQYIEDDFCDYHAASGQLDRYCLYGENWGVIWGLEIKIISDNTNTCMLSVNGGAAIDRRGRLIYLSDSEDGKVCTSNSIFCSTYDLCEDLPCKLIINSEYYNSRCYISIQFYEIERSAHDYEDASNFGKTEQVPWVRLLKVDKVDQDTDDEKEYIADLVILGIVTIDGEGKITKLTHLEPDCKHKRPLLGKGLEEVQIRQSKSINGVIEENLTSIIGPLESGGLKVSVMNETDRKDAMVITSDGKVGIGTTTPEENLHIHGSICGNVGESRALKIQTEHGYVNIGPTNKELSHFSTDRPKFYFNQEIQVNTGNIGSYDEDLNLRTSGDTQLTIKKENGYIGIGTTKPEAKLHVDGSLKCTSLNVDETLETLNCKKLNITEKLNLDNHNDICVRGRIGQLLNGEFGKDRAQWAVIGDLNKLGTHPKGKEYYGLKVQWDTDAAIFGLRNFGGDRKDAVISWGDNITDNLRFLHSDHRNDAPKNKDLMIITGEGKVGIGTTEPESRLDVKGSIQAYDFRLTDLKIWDDYGQEYPDPYEPPSRRSRVHIYAIEPMKGDDCDPGAEFYIGYIYKGQKKTFLSIGRNGTVHINGKLWVDGELRAKEFIKTS